MITFVKTVTCVLVILFLASLTAGFARAESAPTLLNFQGRLTSSAGAPVTAAQSVRFTLLQGGTASENPSTGTVVYQEDATVSPDANGVFARVLGAGTPVAGHTLTESDFIANGLPLYVELKIGAETLLPRTRLLSGAYAIEASRLDGRSAAEIIGQSGGNVYANEVVRRGAVLEWISGTQIRVRPGVLGFSDGKVRKTTANLVWDGSNPDGPLGLDTGSRVANTFYYMYAIPDPGNDAQFTAIASANAPIDIGGTGPAGYGIHRFIGSFRTETSSTGVLEFYRSGNAVMWRGNAAWWLYNGQGAQPSDSINQWKTIDASAWEPPTARAVILNGYYDAWGSAAIRFSVATKSGGLEVFFCTDWQNGGGTCDATVATFNRSFAYLAALWSGWSNDGSQATAFGYRGYEEDLSEF